MERYTAAKNASVPKPKKIRFASAMTVQFLHIIDIHLQNLQKSIHRDPEPIFSQLSGFKNPILTFTPDLFYCNEQRERAHNLWFIHSLVTIITSKNIKPSTHIVSRLVRTGLYESEAATYVRQIAQASIFIATKKPITMVHSSPPYVCTRQLK